MAVAVFPLQPLLMMPAEIDLKTLYPDCSAGIETANFEPRLNTELLLSQVQHATARDQLVCLEWLLGK